MSPDPGRFINPIWRGLIFPAKVDPDWLNNRIETRGSLWCERDQKSVKKTRISVGRIGH